MRSEIFFIIEEFNASGGIKILTSIANTLAKSGKDITIYIPSYSEEPFYKLHNSIKIKKIGNKKSKFLYFLNIVFLVNRIGVIVTPNYRIAAIVGLVKRSKKDMVLLIQGDDYVSLIKHSSSYILQKYINKIFFKISKSINVERIFVSAYLMNIYRRKGTLIPNYIADHFLDVHEKPIFDKEYITIGTVSTSAPNKGFDFFLKCMDDITEMQELSKYKFKFKCATQDRVLLNSKGSREIEFISANNDLEMRDFYIGCDILLSCSISEGFNLPVLESMASGCIVIATNDGGVTDFIEDGINGYLIKIRDPRIVTIKLHSLLQNKEYLYNIQQMAIQKAKQYSRERFDNAYLDFFNNLCNNIKE